MKQTISTKKLLSSIFVTILLLYFMENTTSPKIIFVPFLVCSISMVAKNISLIMHQEKLAMLFHRLFVLGFVLFWVGFLVMACYLSIRDKNYGMLLFSLPFWLAGFFIIRNKLFNRKVGNHGEQFLTFRTIVSAGLVILALSVGIFLLILGIKDRNHGLIFAGIFFTLGSFTFVLAALMVFGYFDHIKIDIFGIYVGILFSVFGIGFAAYIVRMHAFQVWILIPLLMAVVGVLQIIKCLRNPNE